MPIREARGYTKALAHERNEDNMKRSLVLCLLIAVGTNACAGGLLGPGSVKVQEGDAAPGFTSFLGPGSFRVHEGDERPGARPGPTFVHGVFPSPQKNILVTSGSINRNYEVLGPVHADTVGTVDLAGAFVDAAFRGQLASNIQARPRPTCLR